MIDYNQINKLVVEQWRARAVKDLLEPNPLERFIVPSKPSTWRIRMRGRIWRLQEKFRKIWAVIRSKDTDWDY